MAAKLIRGCLVLALVSLASAGLANAESRRSYGHTLVASLLEEPLELDPLEVQTHTELTMVSLLFDTLYQMREGKLVPHLASGLPDAAEPLRVRIPLRDGVQFHDGRPLSARDVASSLDRLRNSRFAYLIDSVKSVEAGPGELFLNMHRADPELAASLADVHTAITAGGRAPTWRRLQGSGVFRLKQRLAGAREVHLVANEQHFAGRVFVDTLVLRWFEDAASEARRYETGDSLMSLRGDIAFAGHRPKYRTASVQGEPRILAYLGFGKGAAITSEAEFRHAVSAAIGRNGMEQIGSGEKVQPTVSVLPRRSRAGLKADTRTAGRLISALAKRFSALEAGTLELELIVNKSRPDDAAIADRVAAALFRLGIRTRRVELDAKRFLSRARSGQCDLYIGQLALVAPADEDLLRAAFVAGRREKDLRSLAGAPLEKLVKTFDNQLPIVPLFQRGLRLHYRTDVHGVSFSRDTRLLFEDLFVSGTPEKN